MERIVKIVLYVLLAASLLAASSYYYALEFYKKMVAEDSPFEYATAFVLLAISILFLVRIIKHGKEKNRYWLTLSIIVSLGAFFGFGEEISWGQRIFSVESSDFFATQNLQAETNLHNLKVGGVNINKLIFSQGLVLVFGLYFVLAQILYRRVNYFQKLVDLFGVQIPQLKHSIMILVCTGVVLLIPEKRIWELWEAIFAIVLLLVFIDPFNKKEKLIT